MFQFENLKIKKMLLLEKHFFCLNGSISFENLLIEFFQKGAIYKYFRER